MNLSSGSSEMVSASQVADGSIVAWTVVGAVGILALAGSSVRTVPDHQRIVVTRFGRIVRVAGPGLTTRLPGLEKWKVVSLRPEHLATGVTALTSDGVEVHLRVNALFHVTDPARLTVVDDLSGATATELEGCVVRAVTGTRLIDLLPDRQDLNTSLPTLATGATSAWGVDVSAVEIGAIDAVLSASLLHALESHTESGGP